MVSLNRLANGLCTFALMVAFGTVTITPAQAVTDLERYDAMNLAPMPDELADGLRGEGRFTILIKILDNIGRVQTAYSVVKYFVVPPKFSTCVYSKTANSSPLYCY